jgi:polyisoprenyl-phosphate glycosyltransferase
MSQPLLSIVSPVYGAAAIVGPLVDRIRAAVAPVTDRYEIILVEDSSPDESWSRIVALAAHHPCVRGIRLSRNFGQHAAITAGLAHARGSYVVVMDCDLQDDPAYIPALLAKAREGYDLVLTRKEERQHAWHRNLSARMFASVYNVLAGHRPADPHIGGYSLLTRKVVDAFLRIQDVHRHYLLILGWMGFNAGLVSVEHHPRHSGASSYTFRRLLRHALEGITSQSTMLLKFSVAIGGLYFIAAMAGVAYLLARYLTHGFLAGWASTFVTLVGSTGLILMSVGILGLYIGNIFEQVRGRPLYLVSEEVNAPDSPP